MVPVKYRVQFKILMHTYKALHEQAPRNISDMLTVYQPKRTRRSMGSVTLVVPRVRTSSYGERKVQCSSAKLWNALPAHIRASKTVNIFKKLLKMHLFSSHLGVKFIFVVSYIYINLALYIYCYEIIVLYLLYLIYMFFISLYTSLMNKL